MTEIHADNEADEGRLMFKVAPHLVQDLGLNLYTTLPRVLVEFVANAYDADSPACRVVINTDAIENARKLMRAEYAVELEKANQAAANGDPTVKEQLMPLTDRLLPEEYTIVVEDDGHGMSREDIGQKFLVAGRRRRSVDKTDSTESGNRKLMGRKGLGKLAGFGVARRVEVVSRRKGEPHATRIVLDYSALLERVDISDYPVPEECLEDGGGIAQHGTRIVLSRLVYEAAKSRAETIATDIAQHFSLLRPEEYRILLNGNQIEPAKREYAYAYPNKNQLAAEELVQHTLKTEEEDEITFGYRVRFTKRGHHLPARERGVRVYAHNRLASAPDLLDVKTGVHGFRNTEYLDGVVEADFIDEDKRSDLIATDRQSLRWEVSKLEGLRKFLTTEMENAIREYQAELDAAAQEEADKDLVTREMIQKADLPSHRRKVASKVAGLLARTLVGGTEDPEYPTQLAIFLDGLAQGDIMSALNKLAHSKHPDFHQVVERITELTMQEVDDFLRYVEGRLRGIEALETLYRSVDFKKASNEKELHKLFEKNPWLLDQRFAQYVVSNQTETAVLERLAKELQIGQHTPQKYDPTTPAETEEFGSNLRPDLVFLLGGISRHELVIVELKAPNTALHYDHLGQLMGYMQRAEEWLRGQGGDAARTKVTGMLVGSMPDPRSKSPKVAPLIYAVQNTMDKATWTVRDIGEVLELTKKVHEGIYLTRVQLVAEAAIAGDVTAA